MREGRAKDKPCDDEDDGKDDGKADHGGEEGAEEGAGGVGTRRWWWWVVVWRWCGVGILGSVRVVVRWGWVAGGGSGRVLHR